MESVQEVEPGSIWNSEASARPASTLSDTIPSPVTAGSFHKSFRTLLILQIAVLAAVAAGAVVARESIAALRNSTQAESESQRALIAGLDEKVKSVDFELSSLRQTITSRMSEDVIFLKIMVMKPSIDVELARRIARAVRYHSEQYRRDPDLVLAIMAVESHFNPLAVSSVGASGLMQVMPHWKQVLAIDGDLKDPDVSVRYGLQILGFYENMYQNLELALTAYNRGPGPVDNALVKGRDPKNDYAPRVLQMYDKLKRLSVAGPHKTL